MAYEQRDNSGALFRNDRKEKETQPDYDGYIVIAGRKYRLAAWIKTGKSGTKFMSLAVEEFDADMRQRNDRVEQAKAAHASKDIEPGITF